VREPKQSRRAQEAHARLTGIAARHRVHWIANPEQARSGSCVGKDGTDDRCDTLITGLSLRQAERSSHRSRHTHCSVSSISPVWARRAEMLEFLAKQERAC
jgi:hypothetical protein